MPQLVESTLVLLKQESVCQQIESDSDVDDDDTSHDEVLMDAVSDLLPAFAKAMGSHFAPIFSTLFEPLMKFAVSFLICIYLVYTHDEGGYFGHLNCCLAERITTITRSDNGGCMPC